jgi:hypothetical protein
MKNQAVFEARFPAGGQKIDEFYFNLGYIMCNLEN